jgi:hypothetical protein
MSLQEKAPKRRTLPEPLDVTELGHLHDSQVLTQKEFGRLNRLSDRETRRIWNHPDPKVRPKLTQLTAKRKGITVGNNRRWQESRAR